MKPVNNDPIRTLGNYISGILIIAGALAFWLLPIVLLAWLIAFFLKSCT